jgi:DnaA family protein
MSLTPQLPLALRPASDFRFETFVGAPEVLGRLRAMAAGEPGFVLLSGAEGSGKTHLAIATAQAAAAAGIAVQYVPLAHLQGRVEQGLAGLDRLGLVVLDGLDAVLGARADEVALFDFHNRCQAAGCEVLYVAHQAPGALAVGLPDLRSRLGQCVQLTLPRRDDVQRGAILQRKAQDRGWTLDESAVAYLLRRVGRDMASLVTLLDQLDRLSLAEQRRVTVPLIRAFLEQGEARDETTRTQ